MAAGETEEAQAEGSLAQAKKEYLARSTFTEIELRSMYDWVTYMGKRYYPPTVVELQAKVLLPTFALSTPSPHKRVSSVRLVRFWKLGAATALYLVMPGSRASRRTVLTTSPRETLLSPSSCGRLVGRIKSARGSSLKKLLAIFVSWMSSCMAPNRTTLLRCVQTENFERDRASQRQ